MKWARNTLIVSCFVFEVVSMLAAKVSMKVSRRAVEEKAAEVLAKFVVERP